METARAPARHEKRGAEYSGNCSSFDRFSHRADNAPKQCQQARERTIAVHYNGAHTGFFAEKSPPPHQTGRIVPTKSTGMQFALL
ncbi:hypothetical protein [Pseudomonas sp.]|uniref:hypothetical protein n=1 Tax=Pseudomonas sp. TaxID=306 RepID=UPI003D0D3741